MNAVNTRLLHRSAPRSHSPRSLDQRRVARAGLDRACGPRYGGRAVEITMLRGAIQDPLPSLHWFLARFRRARTSSRCRKLLFQFVFELEIVLIVSSPLDDVCAIPHLPFPIASIEVGRRHLVA